jgi:3-isopropylmalate dehydrogenase
MLLRFSLSLKEEAAAIEAAVEQAINDGYRTEDLREEGTKVVSTQEMGQYIANILATVHA